MINFFKRIMPVVLILMAAIFISNVESASAACKGGYIGTYGWCSVNEYCDGASLTCKPLPEGKSQNAIFNSKNLYCTGAGYGYPSVDTQNGEGASGKCERKNTGFNEYQVACAKVNSVGSSLLKDFEAVYYYKRAHTDAQYPNARSYAHYSIIQADSPLCNPVCWYISSVTQWGACQADGKSYAVNPGGVVWTKDSTKLTGSDSCVSVPTTRACSNGACSATKDQCTAGTFSDVTDSSDKYLWSCVGTFGTTASCSANKTPGTESCSDGIKNQNETGVDCGGVCPACSNGGGGTNGKCGTFDKAIFASNQNSWPTGSFCASGTQYPTTAPAFPTTGSPATWACNAIGSGTSENCSANLSNVSYLGCFIDLDGRLQNNKVAINSPTTWRVMDINTNNEIPATAYSRTWYVKETADGPYTEAGIASELTRIFNTTGLKEVKVQLATTSAPTIVFECSTSIPLAGGTSFSTTSAVVPTEVNEY